MATGGCIVDTHKLIVYVVFKISARVKTGHVVTLPPNKYESGIAEETTAKKTTDYLFSVMR